MGCKYCASVGCDFLLAQELFEEMENRNFKIFFIYWLSRLTAKINMMALLKWLSQDVLLLKYYNSILTEIFEDESYA